MKWIILILIIIILLLITYLFSIKKDLKIITESIKNLKKNNSNYLIHSDISLKELSELIKEINILIKESKNDKIIYNQKNKNLRKMMTNISHDLRTPLTSALGYIDIILKSDLSEEEKEKDLKIVEERLKRLEELINSFFEFSKIVSNNNLPELNDVNIISVIEESIVHYYEDYKKNNREIIFNSNVQKYKIKSNKDMLIRIFDNLINNAFKHSDGNLEIKIECNSNIKISFTNKLLYDDLDIDHIFDEFYTIDISRTKGNTGLGLAIVKEFTDVLGGKIYAKKTKRNLNIIIEFKNK